MHCKALLQSSPLQPSSLHYKNFPPPFNLQPTHSMLSTSRTRPPNVPRAKVMVRTLSIHFDPCPYFEHR